MSMSEKGLETCLAAVDEGGGGQGPCIAGSESHSELTFNVRTRHEQAPRWRAALECHAANQWRCPGCKGGDGARGSLRVCRLTDLFDFYCCFSSSSDKYKLYAGWPGQGDGWPPFTKSCTSVMRLCRCVSHPSTWMFQPVKPARDDKSPTGLCAAS